MISGDSSIWTRLRELIRSRNGPRYQQVGFNGEATKFKSAPRMRNVLLVLTTVVVVAVLYVYQRGFEGLSYREDVAITSISPPKFFHLLIDAPQRDPNLCKAMVSASVLGYPGATFVGWQETLEEQKAVLQLGLYEKSIQIERFLENKANDDLVLIVDGYHTWFQLRPQTLVDRFFEINRKADKRLQSEFGLDVMNSSALNQRVVFGAQKTCSPWKAEDPACYAVPDATLPVGIYSSLSANSTSEYKNGTDRQRYLSTGTIMGTVKAIRALYKEATYRITQDDKVVSDQQLFSSIFGEQELHRELLRRQSKSTWRQSVSGVFSKDDRAKLFKPEHLEGARGRGKALELGIGLDYESEISFATQSAHHDVSWITFSGSSEEANKAAGISQKNSRVESVQPDIASTVPPFWTFSNEETPRNIAWEDVSLLTNVFTGITPVIIEHNGVESLRKDWWGEMWFHKHARTLYTTHIYTPQVPVALAGSDSLREYWTTDDYKGGARNTSWWWYRYDDICDGTQDEVFRDHGDRWLIPDNH